MHHYAHFCTSATADPLLSGTSINTSEVMAMTRKEFSYTDQFGRSLCGSLSWQIMNQDGSAYEKNGRGRRFVITYQVPDR